MIKMLALIFTLLTLFSCSSLEMYDATPVQAMCYDKDGNVVLSGKNFSWDKCYVDFAGRQYINKK